MTTLAEVVVFGEALTDFIRTGTDSWRHRSGGSCWNVARVVSRLGRPTGFAGAVSADIFGEELRQLSREAGLLMDYTQQQAGDPLLAMVWQTDPPRYFFAGSQAADTRFRLDGLPVGWEAAARCVHFGGLGMAREPLASSFEHLACRLAGQGMRISYDPNWRNAMDGSYRRRFETMLRVSTWIKLSDEDLAQLLPELDAADALSWVLDRAGADSATGSATVLHTRGAHGVAVLQSPAAGTAPVQVPAFPVPVADTVGAGDAFAGGWIFSNLNWPERQDGSHARFAAAVAALACTRSGAWAPSLPEVEAFLAKNHTAEAS